MEKTSTGLSENVAGLLCYVLGWVSGIVFILIEPENRFVRFHAIQSIIVFGVLTVAGIILRWIPVIGWIFYWISSRWIPVIGWIFYWIISVLGLILWIVLMVKAYQGARYKIPWAGDIAEKRAG